MKKKIVSIFVSMLLFVTVLSVTGATNIEKTVSVMPNSVSTAIVWEDDFESYALGSSLHGQGGWRGWDDDPTWTAYVTDNESHSPDQSMDCAGDTDIIHEFDGITSGTWTFTDWIYVPSDMVGQSYFILLSDYEDGMGQSNLWALQVHFDADLGNVVAEHDGDELPLITDEWVEMRVEIDLENDWFECYYGGELLQEKNWTATPNNDFTGKLAIDAVDIFANGATSVYHDDLTLEGEVGADPDMSCDGSLSWENVSTGEELTGSFTIENIGSGLLDWEITKNPSWGTWSFDPDSGDDLAPGTPVTVEVTVIAPDDKNEEFSGGVTVENKEDDSDYCYIDVYLSTPMSHTSLFLQFLERLVQRFPVLELIFSYLLE